MIIGNYLAGKVGADWLTEGVVKLSGGVGEGSELFVPM